MSMSISEEWRPKKKLERMIRSTAVMSLAMPEAANPAGKRKADMKLEKTQKMLKNSRSLEHDAWGKYDTFTSIRNLEMNYSDREFVGL